MVHTSVLLCLQNCLNRCLEIICPAYLLIHRAVVEWTRPVESWDRNGSWNIRTNIAACMQVYDRGNSKYAVHVQIEKTCLL